MIDMEVSLKALSSRIRADLDKCPNQDKRDARTYSDLKMETTTDEADIKGLLDLGVIKSDSCCSPLNKLQDECLTGIKLPFQPYRQYPIS